MVAGINRRSQTERREPRDPCRFIKWPATSSRTVARAGALPDIPVSWMKGPDTREKGLLHDFGRAENEPERFYVRFRQIGFKGESGVAHDGCL